jgi:hypothetical protein
MHILNLLSHAAVEILVVDFGASGHVRLQHLDGVLTQELMHGVAGFLRSASFRAPVGQASQHAVVSPFVMRW